MLSASPPPLAGRAVTLLSLHPLFDTRIAGHMDCLLRAGAKVTYLNWGEGGQIPQPPGAPAIQLVHRHASPIFGKNLFRFAFALWWFTWHALRCGADIVHIHDPQLLPVVWPLRLLTRAKIIFDMHEYYLRDAGPVGAFARRIAWPFCLPLCHGLVGVHADMKPTRAMPFRVVPNYQSQLAFEAARQQLSAQPAPRDLIRIIYFGSLSTADRDIALLATLAEKCLAQHPRISFEIGGKLAGPGAPAIETQFRELTQRYPDRFAWLGLVPRNDVIHRTVRADVGLWLMKDDPNFRGSSPNKIFEYLQAGLAMLITPGASVLDEIQQAGAAVVIPPGTSADVAAAKLLDMIADPAKLARMKSASRSLAPKYTWEEAAQAYLDLYHELGVPPRPR